MSNSGTTLVLLFLGILAFPADSTQQAPTFECGRPKFTSRIAGGSEATPGEFPWMAHFQIRSTTTYELFSCGGTLISDRHVLTAAHCLQNGSDLMNKILSITLGAHDINNDDGHHQTFGWKRIATYSNWNLENDIAIVTLSRPVNFTDYVKPACLPAEDPDHDNDSVVLTGWGQHDSSGSFSSVLRKTETTVISSFGNDSYCQQAGGVGNFSGDNVVCSDGSQGHRFRYGDDGGPMNFYNAECGRWFVLGVAGRGNSYGINGPNVFTRVRAQLEFIHSHTEVSSPADCSSTTNSTEPTTPGPKTTSTTTQKITTTTNKTNKPIAFSCAGKANGNYPNPASSCSNTFYACSNGNAYLFNCASDLVYREDIGVCDWPSNVAGCH